MNGLVTHNERVHAIICTRTFQKRVTEMSEESVIVRIEKEILDPNYLRSLIDIEGCGSVVSFVGLTRADDNGIEVKRLEFDSWEEKLTIILSDIAKNSIHKFGVKSVLVAHRIGVVEPTEPIVCIHVSSRHRDVGFQACSWLITQLKLQAPLWKKEVRIDGEVWKQGLG